MSHVDEGRLHAYLDGELDAAYPGEAGLVEAHLLECAVCRARLSDAQATRLRARDLLSGAVPDRLAMPGFDTVAVRAAATTSGRGAERTAALPPRPGAGHRRTLHRRAVALGWAASLVAALCAGWFASEARLRLADPAEYATREMRGVSPAPVAAGGRLAESGPAAAEPVETAALPAEAPAGREPGTLSIEQFFALYEALPAPEHFGSDPLDATEPLRQWESAHPRLAEAYPAAPLLRWFWMEYERRQGDRSG